MSISLGENDIASPITQLQFEQINLNTAKTYRRSENNFNKMLEQEGTPTPQQIHEGLQQLDSINHARLAIFIRKQKNGGYARPAPRQQQIRHS